MLRGREEIARFARRMLHTLNLPKNKVKRGWGSMLLWDLQDKLEEEYRELNFAIETLVNSHAEETIYEKRDYKYLWNRIAEEAVDVANVCMMIADRVGGLDEEVK